MIALLLLATTLPAIAGDPGADGTRAPVYRTSAWALVSDVKLVRSAGGGVEIQVTADRPLRSRSHRLSNPERFVVDLQDAVFNGDSRTIDVDAADIQSVRIAPLYQQEGRVTRIVVELAAPLHVDVTRAGDGLVLKFATAAGAQSEHHTDVAALGNPAPQGLSLAAQNLPQAQPGDASPEYALARHSQVADLAPATISAQIADNTPSIAGNTPPAVAVEVAEEKSSGPDVLIFGTGVTGRASDPTLGAEVEQVLGPSKEKKNKVERPGGSGEGSSPHSFHLSGSAIGGYYQADGDSRSGSGFHDASPVGSVHLDASGYLYHPGFFSFTVRPQGGLGRQSSEGIFPDGQGVAGSVTLLGGSTTPLTISYSRLNRSLTTFAPLNRLAGLEANTFQDSLGANWTLRLKRMPEMVFSFSKYSDSYEPLANLAPKTADAGRLAAVEMGEKVMGWNLQTHYKLERSSQDLIDIFAPSQAPSSYKRRDQEAYASADRSFGKWLNVTVLAGDTKLRSQVQDRPFDQSYRFLTVNSLFRPNKKLTLDFHGGVTNNVIGASLQRSAGSTLTPDQPFLPVPLTARLQMVNYSVSAQYALTKDLHLHADALRETTHPQQTTASVAPESSLTSAQAGVSWSRRLRFVQFQSHYTGNVGNFVYGGTGSSRSSGHHVELGAAVGSLHTLELTADFQGGMQDVVGTTYMRNRIWGANLTLSRSFLAQWKLQATYNRSRDHYNFLNQQVSSDGNGLSVALSHPRVDFSASHNIRNGLSFQADPRLQYLSSSQAGMLLGAFPGTLMAPASADWSSASLSIHPVGKFRARGTWLRNRQQMQGAVNNRYTEWEASAGYQFRSLSFDAGYIFHDQDFGVDQFQRNRFFFRALRDFTIF